MLRPDTTVDACSQVVSRLSGIQVGVEVMEMK